MDFNIVFKSVIKWNKSYHVIYNHIISKCYVYFTGDTFVNND